MCYNRTRNKTKLFKMTEEEFDIMNRILEKRGMTFQKYIEFKVREDMRNELKNGGDNYEW